MNTKRILFVLFVLGRMFFLPRELFAESLTMTTYYPSPFGAYDRMKLSPRESLPADEYCIDERDLGLMYYDNGQGEKAEGLYVCQRTSPEHFNWIFISRPVNNETDTVEKAKVVCVKEDGRFGVCIDNPSHDGTCGCH